MYPQMAPLCALVRQDVVAGVLEAARFSAVRGRVKSGVPPLFPEHTNSRS